MGWDMGADVGEKAEPWQGQTEGQVIRRRKNIQRAEPGAGPFGMDRVKHTPSASTASSRPLLASVWVGSQAEELCSRLAAVSSCG